MIFAIVIFAIIFILIYSFVRIDNGEKACKTTYNQLQETLMLRYSAVEELTTYIAKTVMDYQKPMTADFKSLRESNKVRAYEVEHIENYLTDSTIQAMKIAEEREEVDTGIEYQRIIKNIKQVEQKIYTKFTVSNLERKKYNEMLHNFPIILFAKFYGYQDKDILNIRLAFYPERDN